MGLKALVIVHKSFLMDQWEERIKQFTNAKVGIIRQNKKDVKGNDIIIGMLQSLSMIDYEEELFKDISLLVVDECHHMGSKVFSQAFFKIAPKYTIGLSATPIRGDGLTKVLYWFLGEIIVRITRGGNKNIIVKMVKYNSDNKLFVEKKRWFNGKVRPNNVQMVTNLCQIKSRNELCVDIIDSLRRQYERKILILAERIDHLETLKPMLDAKIKEDVESGRCVADEYKTAYYIGKMKSYELEDAAESDIIFASFKMAEEALDIPKLNTLVFASPIKKLEQSVGRILRKECEEGDIPPMIVDISDELSIFKNWSATRLAYYDKSKYSTTFFQGFNNRIETIEEYLIRIGLLSYDKKHEFKDEHDYILFLRKTYVTHAFGEDQYELLEDTEDPYNENSEDRIVHDFYYWKEDFYKTSSNLDEIFYMEKIGEITTTQKLKVLKLPEGADMSRFIEGDDSKKKTKK